MLRDYPELAEYSEFKRSSINANDLMFVWFFRCSASPYYEVPDEKKLDDCIAASYSSEGQRSEKMELFKNLRFPDNIKAAMRRMERFNTTARVEDYLYVRQVRANCKEILGQDVSRMNADEKEKYTRTLPAAMKAMLETTRFIEAGGEGVTEQETDPYDDTIGWLTSLRDEIK